MIRLKALKYFPVLSIALLVLAVSNFSCSNQNSEITDNKSSNTTKSSETPDYYSFFRNEYKEIIEILSLKNQISLDICDTLIDEYLVEYNIAFYSEKTKRDNTLNKGNIFSNTNKSVIEFSNNFIERHPEMNKEKIGQILYDFEIFCRVKEIEEQINL
jgi:hypothetical protein